MPNHQICQRIWEGPPVLFSFIKMCKLFPYHLQCTGEPWQVIWFLHAWQLSINSVISFIYFSFRKKIIEMNYPMLCVQPFKAKPQREKSAILGFSKQTCTTATLTVTAFLDFIIRDSHNKEIWCVNSALGCSPNVPTTVWNISTVLYNKKCLQFTGLWISSST